MVPAYQNYDSGYGMQSLVQPSDNQATIDNVQLLAQQDFSYPLEPYTHSPEHGIQAHQQHRIATMDLFLTSPHDAAYSVGQTHILPMSTQFSHGIPACGSQHGSLPTQSAYQEHQQQYRQQYQQRSSARTRSRAALAYRYPELHQVPAPGASNSIEMPAEVIARDGCTPMESQACTYSSGVLPTHSSSANPGLPNQDHRYLLRYEQRCAMKMTALLSFVSMEVRTVYM